jgi:hypothetical protein
MLWVFLTKRYQLVRGSKALTESFKKTVDPGPGNGKVVRAIARDADPS